jgi:hypothetical protein
LQQFGSEVNDLAESRSSVRAWATPILFALIAALAGMTTCRLALGVVVRGTANSTKPLPYPKLTFLSPFLVGAVVAAVAYLALPRILAALSGAESRSPAANTTLAPGNHGSSAAKHNEPRPATGPIAILVIVVAISTLIAAGMAGLLTNNDVGEVSAAALLGGGLGLLIGIPAALLVWVATRRRRPEVTSDADKRPPESSK